MHACSVWWDWVVRHYASTASAQQNSSLLPSMTPSVVLPPLNPDPGGSSCSSPVECVDTELEKLLIEPVHAN